MSESGADDRYEYAAVFTAQSGGEREMVSAACAVCKGASGKREKACQKSAFVSGYFIVAEGQRGHNQYFQTVLSIAF